MKRKTLAVFGVAILLVGAVAPAMAAVVTDSSRINFAADSVPDPEVSTTVTKDVHKIGWSAATYEGDDGSNKTLAASLNASNKNPVSYVPTDVEFADAGAFPHDNQSLSALHADEWTKSGTNSSQVSITNTTTAPGVEALNIGTTSFEAGDSATAKYTFNLDSDESKRYLQLFADVNSIESGTHVEIRLVDEDGDYKTVVIDSANKTSADRVLANSTGEGYVLQQQLGTLSTTTVGGSDGTFDNIASLQIVVTDGDFGGSFSVINAEKLSPYTLGSQWYDSGDDDSKMDETRELTEPVGSTSIDSFDTFGSTFDSAIVHDAAFDMNFSAAQGEVRVNFRDDSGDSSKFPSYDVIADYYYTLKLPDAYDLSYSSAELRVDRELPTSRYQTVEVAEGTGDTNVTEISSWTDKTTTVENGDDSITLDNTIQPGDKIVFHGKLLLTSDEKSNAMAAMSGGVGPTQEDSGGFFSSPISYILGILGIGGGVKLLGGSKNSGGS